jgi:transcriptional regulator with XRE-family HTH domain
MASPLSLFSGLGPALRLIRETVGLKQVQVAERSGIAQSRLSHYESGRRVPDVRTLDRLLVFYGADLERLGHALEEVRGERVVKKAIDPEFLARVKKALAQLGYPTPKAPG